MIIYVTAVDCRPIIHSSDNNVHSNVDSKLFFFSVSRIHGGHPSDFFVKV